MSVTVRDNERSWAIELISEINRICANYDLKIKKAGGEKTVAKSKQSMFPDVMLFEDQNRTTILQGWELKMPDVPIENDVFVKDAQRKADALGLSSCLIWNFTYAVLFVKTNSGFVIAKEWNSTSFIRTREDVNLYQTQWKTLLEEVVLYVNDFLIHNSVCTTSIKQLISNYAITELVKRNKTRQANYLKIASSKDSFLEATIEIWWLGIKDEYASDETDKYEAFAKNIILSWSVRILFAHIIKNRQNSALSIDGFDESTTPKDLNEIFDFITNKCDFYSVFAPFPCNEHVQEDVWRDLVAFSAFLKENSIRDFDQESFQNILEETVSSTRRELNGQFTTPEVLAEILLKLTVKNWNGSILDCCCGTGTIPQKAISIKIDKTSVENAIESVWACDKYSYPLQVANISMSRPETINKANFIFKHNALTLVPGTEVFITDPSTGVKDKHVVPAFDAIVSNLPFVPFEHIPEDDLRIIQNDQKLSCMSGRSDLYCSIAIHLDKMLSQSGRIGIITSNSWLAVNNGEFYSVLDSNFDIKQIHISGNGRWFKNADVVTTLIILEKKTDISKKSDPSFVLWRKTIEEISNDEETKSVLINGSLLSSPSYPEVFKISKYSHEDIRKIRELNVSYNTFFHEVGWLLDFKDKLVPIKSIFKVFRGSRRGWDKLFYPDTRQTNIEKEYLRPVLKNARGVLRLDVVATDSAFCCSDSVEELESERKNGALSWIRTFENQCNGIGRPLPEVLAKNGVHWYELEEKEIAQFFTMMNPDERFFCGKFESPSFINQRLIGMNVLDDYSDVDCDLLHAFLNSVLFYYFIEGSGFGRGQGVLDINKDSIERCYILNPRLLNERQKNDIKEKFEVIKARSIRPITEEIMLNDRLEFEKALFTYFGLEEHLADVIESFSSMISARKSVNN